LPLPLATPIEGVLVGYLKKNQKQYVRKVKVKYYKPGTLVDIWQPYDVKWADRSLKFDRSRKEKNFWNCCSNSPIAFQRGQRYFQVYGMQLYLPSDFYWNSHVEDNTQREEMHVPARLAATQISTLKAVQKRHNQNQKQYARKVKVKYYKPGALVDVWRPYDVKEADRTCKFT